MEVHVARYYSMALALLVAARSAAPASLPASSQTGESSDTNGQRLFRMLSSKLHNQCLQMDTFACLGLKVLFSTARHLDSPVIGQVSDQRALAKEADVDKILMNNVVHYISSNMRQSRHEKEVKKKEKDKEEDDNAEVSEEDGLEKRVEDFARGSFFTRKMLFPLLIGIVLKLASLIPLVLGKMTLLGTMSFLSSKLALLIIILMNLKKWFSGGMESGGHSQQHSLFDIPQFYPQHDLEGRHPHYHSPSDYPDYQQAAHPIHPSHPLHPVHPVPHSGMGMGLPYHRKTFVVRGRQLGDDLFWSSGNNSSEKSDRQLKEDMIWFAKVNDTTNITANGAHLNSDDNEGTDNERREKINEDKSNSSNIDSSTEIHIPKNEQLEVNNEWKPIANGNKGDGTSSNVKRIAGSRDLDRKYIWKPSEQLNNTEEFPNISTISARRAEYILRSRQLRYTFDNDSSLPVEADQIEEKSSLNLEEKKRTYNNYKGKSSDTRNKGNKFHKLASYDDKQNHDISTDGESISILPSNNKDIVVTDASVNQEVNRIPQASGSEIESKHSPTTEKYEMFISDRNLEEIDADTIPLYPTSADITLNDEEHYGEEIPDGFDMEFEHNNGNNEPFISSLGTSRGYLAEVDSEGKNSIRRLDATGGEHVDLHEVGRTNNA